MTEQWAGEDLARVKREAGEEVDEACRDAQRKLSSAVEDARYQLEDATQEVRDEVPSEEPGWWDEDEDGEWTSRWATSAPVACGDTLADVVIGRCLCP